MNNLAEGLFKLGNKIELSTHPDSLRIFNDQMYNKIYETINPIDMIIVRSIYEIVLPIITTLDHAAIQN